MKKVTSDDCKLIRRLFHDGISQKQLSEQFGLSASNISNVINNKTHFDEKYKRTNIRRKLDINYCCELRKQNLSFPHISRLEHEKYGGQIYCAETVRVLVNKEMNKEKNNNKSKGKNKHGK